MELRLDGKVALVTGASKGIGRAIASGLAESGARVMLSSRKLEALEEAAATINGEVAVHAANAGDPDQASACVDATLERFGGLDILVNNAAILRDAFVFKLEPRDWEAVIQTNLSAAAYMTAAATPAMPSANQPTSS